MVINIYVDVHTEEQINKGASKYINNERIWQTIKRNGKGLIYDVVLGIMLEEVLAVIFLKIIFLFSRQVESEVYSGGGYGGSLKKLSHPGRILVYTHGLHVGGDGAGWGGIRKGVWEAT